MLFLRIKRGVLVLMVGLSAIAFLVGVCRAQNDFTAASLDNPSAVEPGIRTQATYCRALPLIGSFETFNRLGFSPDGVTIKPYESRYSMTGELIISSAGPNPGLFRTTPYGVLLKHIPFPSDIHPQGSLGFGVAYATAGPRRGHYFLPEFTGTPEINVYELDSRFKYISHFKVTGLGCPGDDIAFNPVTQNLVVVDMCAGPGFGALIEVKTNGEPVRSFPTPTVAGVTYNEHSRTYFGASGRFLVEFNRNGQFLRQFDLEECGAGTNAVGVAYREGLLYVTDEGDPPDTGGMVYIFLAPRYR